MESNLTENKKRPGWVWVISIFYFFSAAYTLLSFYLVLSGKIPLPPAQKAFLESLTFIDWGLTILGGLITLMGSVFLFCLRKQAYYFFIANIALGILTISWNIIGKGFLQAVGPSALIGMLIGWGMLIAVCVYTKKLKNTGVLN